MFWSGDLEAGVVCFMSFSWVDGLMIRWGLFYFYFFGLWFMGYVLVCIELFLCCVC